MGRWGTLAVTLLLLGAAICPLADDGVATPDGGFQWRPVGEGNNTTAQVPLWAYAVIVAALAGGAIMVVWSSLYYRRKRMERLEASLRVMREWEERTPPSRGLQLVISIVGAALCSGYLTLMVQAETGWAWSRLLLLFAIVTALIVALLELSSSRQQYNRRTWKRTDIPFDQVVEGVELALQRRGIEWRRVTPEVDRRSVGRVNHYELDDAVIAVSELTRRSMTRVTIGISHDGDVEGLKRDIDWELRG